MSIAPAELSRTDIAEDLSVERPWITLVWNDPVNLMSYVTYVFQTYFGYSREKAERLMLDVHHKGRAVVSNGPRGLTGLRAVGHLPEGRLSGTGLQAQGGAIRGRARGR